MRSVALEHSLLISSVSQVAGLVAKYFHILSLQNAVRGSPRRFKAVFLVPIKALVDQQCVAFRKVFIDQPEQILATIDTQAAER
jgi:ERCC4-related helicase